MKWFYRLAIEFYQKRISPNKGYRCAYSLQYGGTGCSGAVLGILEQDGLIRGWGKIKARFSQCSESADELNKREKEKKNKNNDGGNKKPSDRGSGGADCLDLTARSNCCEMQQLIPRKLPSCDVPSCDVPSCDVPSCTMVSILFRRSIFRTPSSQQIIKNCGFGNIAKD